MTVHTPTRSRRLRAILAGGLVLGLGAIVTLASWNDSEFATGSFAAGSFNLEGSATNGTTFTEHPTAGTAAPLTFVLNPTNLAPGDVVYAPFAVRLAAGTTSPAAVTLTSSPAGSFTGLTYQLLATAAFGCTSATTGTDLVAAGTALVTVPGSATFPLAVGSPTTSPGAAEFLCFKVTAGPSLVQAQTGIVTWDFTAVSQ